MRPKWYAPNGADAVPASALSRQVRYETPLPGAVAAEFPQRRAQHLVAGDQRQHRRKAHLKRYARYILRLEQNQHHRGQSEAAQRDSASPGKHREGIETGHGETANDGQVHARQHHVSAADHQGRDGCQLLRRPVQGGMFGC